MKNATHLVTFSFMPSGVQHVRWDDSMLGKKGKRATREELKTLAKEWKNDLGAHSFIIEPIKD